MKQYRYDIHVHTKETSSCGWIPAVSLVDIYHQMGYTGIAVTDHLHESFIKSTSKPRDWPTCVDHFLAGYRAAKERGDQLGLDVILGVELRTPEGPEDYLLYGVDEEFLLRHPFLHRTTPERLWEELGDELLIIQAHPYRGGGAKPLPQYLHGVEVVNCNPRHDNRNDRAVALAKDHAHLLPLCSSDAHRPGDPGRAAVLFCRRVADSADLRALLTEEEYRLDCGEFQHLLGKTAPAGRSHKRRKHHAKTL